MFNPKDIEKFVKEHIQQKIDNNELHLTGIIMDGIIMDDEDLFKHEFLLYETALFEGVCNGIIMCGGKIEGIE